MSVFPGSNSIEASENSLALTGAQLGIWNAQRLDPESRSYLVGEVLEIIGDDAIDTALLADAIRATIGEAETMRLRMIEAPRTSSDHFRRPRRRYPGCRPAGGE